MLCSGLHQGGRLSIPNTARFYLSSLSFLSPAALLSATMVMMFQASDDGKVFQPYCAAAISRKPSRSSVVEAPSKGLVHLMTEYFSYITRTVSFPTSCDRILKFPQNCFSIGDQYHILPWG